MEPEQYEGKAQSSEPLAEKEKEKTFSYDYSYWSFDPQDPNYASQGLLSHYHNVILHRGRVQ